MMEERKIDQMIGMSEMSEMWVLCFDFVFDFLYFGAFLFIFKFF